MPPNRATGRTTLRRVGKARKKKAARQAHAPQHRLATHAPEAIVAGFLLRAYPHAMLNLAFLPCVRFCVATGPNNEKRTS